MCGEIAGEWTLDCGNEMGDKGSGGELAVKKLSGNLWVKMGLGVEIGVTIGDE
jgi:hypothetical protein